MAIYESKLYSTNQETHLKERYIYGVERHGHIREHIELYNNGVVAPSSDPYVENTLGKKRYELKSYNDNVHVVITDRKVYDNTEDVFEAVIVQQSDYYAFGMSMPGRSIYNEPICFGYHGMEMDSEHKGDGNHYTTYFRQYDPRLGRWMSLDPESAMFPFESNYAANHNNPVCFIDSEGDSPILVAFAIGVGGEFISQFFKNFIKYYGDEGWSGVWQNIDYADVLISGASSALMPALGVFSKFASNFGVKNLLKRAIKYSFKFFTGEVDGFIRRNDDDKLIIEFYVNARSNEDRNGDNQRIKIFSKDENYVRWDRLVNFTIGFFLTEFDLNLGGWSTGLYSTNVDLNWFYSFTWENFMFSSFVQGFFEGTFKGLAWRIGHDRNNRADYSDDTNSSSQDQTSNNLNNKNLNNLNNLNNFIQASNNSQNLMQNIDLGGNLNKGKEEKKMLKVNVDEYLE